MSSHFDAAASKWDHDPAKIERAKITAERIRGLPFGSRNSLVDFGSGTGLLGLQLKDTFTRVLLVDSSPEMLRVAREKITEHGITNVETCHGDSLTDVASRHSAIATLMALHHMADVKAFFAEAYQTLEPEGFLIIADLVKEDGSFHKHMSSFSGHNGFDTEVLSGIAAESGFRVHSVEHYHEIVKKSANGEKRAYPLFLFAAIKQALP
ncbi:class I SAM-dependent methyltransferase [Chrysiogenes arsenatis]|uniref:class I SAM-dependent methyltransferase n=1 Tax=Chrysiogenes arsenatis TaxID=309797 RepID=UPI0004064FD8|nr:class I SAM-dependent methyltransferase [Chrysiogenes arsenatis]